MKTINIIGDSHTGALGPRLRVLLAGNDVWFDSFPGFSTARVLGELEKQELRPADLTVVILGGNDFGDRTRERTHLLEFLAEKHAGQILWVSPAYSMDTGVDARHRLQADAQREQFELIGMDWIDSYPATQQGHARDGVHFTSAGYDTWAAYIAKAVTRTQRSFWPIVGWAAILGVVAGIFYKTLRLGRR
jgi:lysophospholipase L1-like esterase